jgi:hypothetical protein
MASSDSRERRNGHKHVSPGARRWRIEATGPQPFTRTTPARCSWVSRIGVVNFSMAGRWPQNN